MGFPPKVELILELSTKTWCSTSSSLVLLAKIPQTCAFSKKVISGLLRCNHFYIYIYFTNSDSCLHLIKNEQHSVSSQILLNSTKKFITEMIISTFCLNGFDDDTNCFDLGLDKWLFNLDQNQLFILMVSC